MTLKEARMINECQASTSGHSTFYSSVSFRCSFSLSSFHTFPRCSSTCLLVTLPSVVFPGPALACVPSLSHVLFFFYWVRHLSYLLLSHCFLSGCVFSLALSSGIHLNLIFNCFLSFRYNICSFILCYCEAQQMEISPLGL